MRDIKKIKEEQRWEQRNKEYNGIQHRAITFIKPVRQPDSPDCCLLQDLLPHFDTAPYSYQCCDIFAQFNHAGC